MIDVKNIIKDWIEFFKSPDFIFWAVITALSSIGMFAAIKAWLAGLFIQGELDVLVEHGVSTDILISAITKAFLFLVFLEILIGVIIYVYRYFLMDSESVNRKLSVISVSTIFSQIGENSYKDATTSVVKAREDGISHYRVTRNWTGNQAFSLSAWEIKNDGRRSKIGIAKVHPSDPASFSYDIVFDGMKKNETKTLVVECSNLTGDFIPKTEWTTQRRDLNKDFQLTLKVTLHNSVCFTRVIENKKNHEEENINNQHGLSKSHEWAVHKDLRIDNKYNYRISWRKDGKCEHESEENLS